MNRYGERLSDLPKAIQLLSELELDLASSGSRPAVYSTPPQLPLKYPGEPKLTRPPRQAWRSRVVGMYKEGIDEQGCPNGFVPLKMEHFLKLSGLLINLHRLFHPPTCTFNRLFKKNVKIVPECWGILTKLRYTWVIPVEAVHANLM